MCIAFIKSKISYVKNYEIIIKCMMNLSDE
jgi:hypothetical protein